MRSIVATAVKGIIRLFRILALGIAIFVGTGAILVPFPVAAQYGGDICFDESPLACKATFDAYIQELVLSVRGNNGQSISIRRPVNPFIDSVQQDPNQDGRDHTESCMMTANPVSIATGNKFKTEVDFRTAYINPFELVRNYNRNFTGRGLFGPNWGSSFDKALTFTTQGRVYCGTGPGADATACVGG